MHYCTYKKAADLTGLSYNQVQHICNRALFHAGSKKKKPNLVRQLGQAHYDFLFDLRTLEMWAGKTLKERTVLFHRQFPDKRIAITSLRRLYLKNKIRRKKVRQDKFVPANQLAAYASKCEELLEQLKEAKKQQRKILYLDEVNFTKLAFESTNYSAKNTNLSVDQRDIYVGYRSVIATISEEEGVEQTSSFNSAVTSTDFIKYLKELRKRHDNQPLAILMDQLQVHKSRIVKPWYDTLDIRCILNVGYSFEFNPIEAVFSKVKALFKRTRLNCLVNKTDFYTDKAIRAAFAQITRDHCAACVRKSLFLLERAC